MKVSFFMLTNGQEICVGIADLPFPPQVGDNVTLLADRSPAYSVLQRSWRTVNTQKSTQRVETQLHLLVELNQ